MKTCFTELTLSELEQIQGEGVWSDLGYAVGYGLHQAYEGAKDVVGLTKEAMNPMNWINSYYPGFKP